MAQGFVFWRGRSPVTADSLVAIATLDCDNQKTGDMVQTWILVENESPLDVVSNRRDAANCGNCALRATVDRKRVCYVQIGKAPMAVWKTYHRGQYFDLSEDVRTMQELVRGRSIRLGAYGDPAMLPAHVWHTLLLTAVGHTGYTHQWREAFADAYRPLVMASVESAEEQAQASAEGWRTFRVRRPDEPLVANEFTCPASNEAGKRKTCATCLACDGADRPGKGSVAIIAHGGPSVHFLAVPQSRRVDLAVKA